jgi:hypothetical protein
MRYLVTDISNVVRFLSLGCLGPRTIHDDKYRPDASVRYGGALVLFEDVRSAAQEAARAVGPVVIVELQSDLLASIPGQDGLILTGSLIPASSIARLLFRDEATQREFRTLEYQNVDPAALHMVVAPEVFDVTEASVVAVSTDKDDAQARLDIEAAASVPQPDLVPAERVEDIDRSVGAVAALLRPIRPSKGLLRKVGDVVSAVLESMDGSDAVVGAALALKNEGLLHDAICSAMRKTPHEDVGHDEILDALTGQFPDLAQPLTAIREMLAASRDVALEEFTSRCLCALLLALIGRKPTTLRSFPIASLPDDIEVELLALWYAGLREGGARRPVTDRLGDFEARLQVWAARQGAAGAPPTFPRMVFKPKVHGVVTERWFEYFLEDKSLRVGPIIREFPSLRDRLKSAAMAQQRSAVGIAKTLGVPIVTTVVFRERIAFALDDTRLQVEVPHDIHQETDIESVCATLDDAADDLVDRLADRFVVPPSETP